MISFSSMRDYPPPSSISDYKEKKKPSMGCMLMCFLPKIKKNTDSEESDDGYDIYNNHGYATVDELSNYEVPISTIGAHDRRRRRNDSFGPPTWQAPTIGPNEPMAQYSRNGDTVHLYPMANPMYHSEDRPARRLRRHNSPQRQWHSPERTRNRPNRQNMGLQQRNVSQNGNMSLREWSQQYSRQDSLPNLAFQDTKPLEQFTVWQATVQDDVVRSQDANTVHSRSVRSIMVVSRPHVYPGNRTHGTSSSSVFVAPNSPFAETASSTSDSVRSCVFTAHKPKVERNHDNSILRNGFYSDTRETQEADVILEDDETLRKSMYGRRTPIEDYDMSDQSSDLNESETESEPDDSSLANEPIYEKIAEKIDNNNNGDLKSTIQVKYTPPRPTTIVISNSIEEDATPDTDAEPLDEKKQEGVHDHEVPKEDEKDEYPASVMSGPSVSREFTTSVPLGITHPNIPGCHANHGGVYIQTLHIAQAQEVHIGESVAHIQSTKC